MTCLLRPICIDSGQDFAIFPSVVAQPRVSKAAGVRQSHLTYCFPTVNALKPRLAEFIAELRRGLAKLSHAAIARPVECLRQIAQGQPERQGCDESIRRCTR